MYEPTESISGRSLDWAGDGRQIWPVILNSQWYVIVRTGLDGCTAIGCKACGKTSHNANDVDHRYCGNCHRFLASPEIGETVTIPLAAFRSLVFLQAHYGNLLNMHDGGAREPINLPPALERVLQPLEARAREQMKRGSP